MENRILIKEDIGKLNMISLVIRDEKQQLISRALRFVSSFNSLGMEQMDNNLFHRVIKDGVDEYTAESLEILKDQFKRSGITMEVIMKPAISEQESKIRALKADYMHLLAYADRVPATEGIKFTLADIKITQNGVEVVDKDFKDIYDRDGRTFIEGDLGLALYEKAKSWLACSMK